LLEFGGEMGEDGLDKDEVLETDVPSMGTGSSPFKPLISGGWVASGTEGLMRGLVACQKHTMDHDIQGNDVA
jgi:hypothetical protein